MPERLACPFADAQFTDSTLWLRHVSDHLTESVPPDSPAAKLLRTWQSTAASQTTAGRAQDLQMRLLAAALANRGVIQSVDTGAVQAAQSAATAQEIATALAALAGTYEAQLAASVADRQALRDELAELTERVAALEPPASPEPPEGES